MLAMHILFLFAICFVFLPPLAEGTKNLEDIPSGSTNSEAEEDAQQNDLQFLVGQILDAQEWALANGLTQRVSLFGAFNFAPFSLFPSPFPRALFHKAVDVQKSLQLLYFRAMRDFDFLKEMQRDVIETNEKFRQMVDLTENCYKDGHKQPLIWFCQRADYMTHEKINIFFFLVEVNAGPIGGLGNSSRVSMLHQHVLSMANADTSPAALPPNHTDTMVAKTLHMAWNAFGNSEAVILFIHAHSFDPRLNESRQVANEVERISNGQTKCVFLLLSEAVERLTRHPENFSLILDEQILVAVVHHCYTAENAAPDHLKFIFEIIRRSTAIQNSFYLGLAHTKRMQQLFTLPGVVERFFPRPEEAHMVKAIREVLTKSWSIGEGDEEAEEIIKNHFIFPDSAHLNVAATPELGIFGCLLGNIEDGTVLQQFSGEAHIMKTKLASDNEGGIWNGKSVYDSPLLQFLSLLIRPLFRFWTKEPTWRERRQRSRSHPRLFPKLQTAIILLTLCASNLCITALVVSITASAEKCKGFDSVCHSESPTKTTLLPSGLPVRLRLHHPDQRALGTFEIGIRSLTLPYLRKSPTAVMANKSHQGGNNKAFLIFGRFTGGSLFKPFSGHFSPHFSEFYSIIPSNFPLFSSPPIMSLPEKKAALKRAKNDLAQAEIRHSRRPIPRCPTANRSPIRRPTRPAPPLSFHRRRQLS
ncbi:hypothetical protein niasHT_026398 [Heterodera trifolii]|uniref:Glutathione synthetase n=1 Tax=Heterodera trifolii TaxID=157864 RepID=A0ABD2KPX9_9BILA